MQFSCAIDLRARALFSFSPRLLVHTTVALELSDSTDAKWEPRAAQTTNSVCV